ncbi:GntR family transcriptional regulator [Streptomyces buecherae]|uniref:GntR family transcriptional regulator n=1 Tax=Streptomyces buecherae TaxID=2763006 RepID=UPI001C27FD61|nr:GntR family transcriptional regulator [Streptomyces buecherae]
MATRYEQIAADLRQLINTGALAHGIRLPAETSLAKRYNVGLPTMRRALETLQTEGLIDKRHGAGNFLLGKRRHLDYTNDRCRAGVEAGVRVSARPNPSAQPDVHVMMSCEEATAGAVLAERMGAEEGTPLLRFVYGASDAADASPYSVVYSYVLRSMVDPLQVSTVLDGSPWGDAYLNWLTDAGVTFDHIEERVTARVPRMEEAKLLRTAPGTPVLAVQRTSIDARGNVVETADMLMAGDRVSAVFITPLSEVGAD